MTHKSFKNTKNKLFSLWNDKDRLENQLKIKDTNITNFFNDRGNLKVNKIIYDSGFVAIKPVDANLGFNYSTVQGEKLPAQINYYADFGEFPYIDIDIPDFLIPFVKTDILVKTVPDVEVSGVTRFLPSQWTGDFAEVTGDGTHIFKGLISLANFGTVYSQNQIDDGTINEDFTKKVFNVEVVYFDGVDTWKITGDVRTLFYQVFGAFEAPSFICRDVTTTTATIYPLDIVNTQNDNSDDYGEILSFSSGSLTFKGKQIVTDIAENPGPSCLVASTTTSHNFTVTASPTDVHYGLKGGSKYKLISGNFVFQGNGNFDTFPTSNTIISVSNIQERGFWLFFSSDKRWPFSIANTSPATLEGVYFKKELPNTPSRENGSSVDLPYLEINFLRNQGDHPSDLLITEQVVGGFKDVILFRLRPNKYRVVPNGEIILSSPATTEIETLYPKYDDIYIKAVNSYTLSPGGHSLKTKLTYGPDKQDAEVRILLSIDNPFYWEEQKKIKVKNG